MRPEHFDTIVIGGGSAGCVLAARLSADATHRVLLLEAGPDPQPLPEIIADAARAAELMLTSPYVAMYPTARPDGSAFPVLAGRIVGGGSSVNMMATVRPMAHDFEAWVAYGGEAWSYEAMLPRMRRIEADQDYPDDPIHGAEGPIWVKRSPRLDEPLRGAVAAFIEAAEDAGLPPCPDLNGPRPYGICPGPYATRGGRRHSIAIAYLDPVRSRPNLDIRAEARCLGLDLDGDRVRSVRVLQGGRTWTATADRFVLAAGTYSTPQILLLSGIGPDDELRRSGIRSQLRLDGVGEGYQDHTAVFVTFEGRPMAPEESPAKGPRLVHATDRAAGAPDVYVFQRPAMFVTGLPPMLAFGIYLLEQRTRGRVGLASTDPEASPFIETGLLEHPDDLAAMTGAMAFVIELARSKGLARYYGDLLEPAAGADPAAFARVSFTNWYHGVGTCRIGADDDPLAVVDRHQRVRGLENLWIGDASVIPTVPHANTNVAAVLAAETLADHLLGV